MPIHRVLPILGTAQRLMAGILSVSPIGGAIEVARAPFQVLVFPFFRGDDGTFVYAVFCRRDSGVWQGISGGGEGGETGLEAAKRECWEEAGIPAGARLIALDSVGIIPAESVVGSLLWGPEIHTIPEYSFGVECQKKDLELSGEHSEYKWASLKEGEGQLRWQTNKNALHELDRRLTTPC
jgi:dATP pyrophosphohydrolase